MTDVILCAASNLFRMYVISVFIKRLIRGAQSFQENAVFCLWDFLCGKYSAVSAASSVVGEPTM